MNKLSPVSFLFLTLCLTISAASIYNAHAATQCSTDSYGYEQCETVPDFPDISSHTYREAVEYVQSEAIVQGYPDGTYKPDNPINRAEFTKILIEAILGSTPAETSGTCFPDVEHLIWFEKYVCYAKSQNIIKGYPDGNFGPDNNINFAEAAKIIVKTFAIDHNEESNDMYWFTTYFEALEAQSAIPGSITQSTHAVTRAEMAELIWRIRENLTDRPSLSACDLASILCPSDTVFSGYADDLQPDNIDMSRVREAWMNWYNTERRKQGLHDYTYNNELNRSAYIWSEFSNQRGYIDHKRPGTTAYYDYNAITAWFADLGLIFENIYRVTHTENIGSGFYRCDSSDCTQDLIDALRPTFDFYMGEVNDAYRPHYNSVMNSYFNIIGLGISIAEDGKLYITVHYGTRLL